MVVILFKHSAPLFIILSANYSCTTSIISILAQFMLYKKISQVTVVYADLVLSWLFKKIFLKIAVQDFWFRSPEDGQRHGQRVPPVC